MKNMKVSLKLIAGFLIVILLTVAVGVTGVIGLNSMSNAAESMYSDMAIPLSDLALASEYFQRVRVQLRNAVIYTGDLEQLETVEADLTDRLDNFETDMNAYEASIVREDARRVFTELMDSYNNVMKPGVVTMLENAKLGMPPLELLETMATLTASADSVAEDLRTLNDFRLEIMSDANDGTTELFIILFVVIVAAIIIAVGVSLFLAFYISRLISKPLIPLAGFMAQASSSGDIVLKEKDTKVIGAYAQRKDEIGQTIAAAAAFITRINEVSKILEVVADGDLTVEVLPLSEKDTLGTSLKKMTESLNTMFGEINTSASQVSMGSSQVADGAQALAAGATQQAATVEELSSSVAEVAEKTKENAQRAEIAARLAGSIKSNAEKGNDQMGSMVSAVKEINDASQNISKVIRVIDDIAFQTNILALNAAVEAARAGQHGKGFAVVADEVRSLAAKSAEAAKDTATLIESSTAKAELGMRIADETSHSLSEIVSGIDESATIVLEIATSSEEQATAISQINVGIDQVAQVVQQNSATAEESAAASEEMSSQSAMLQQLASQFKTKPKPGAMVRARPLSD